MGQPHPQRSIPRTSGRSLTRSWLVAGAFAACWGAMTPAGAAVYQWTTPDGVIGLTDDPGRIPEQYRASAKPYRGPGSELSTVASPEAPSTPAESAPPAEETDLFGHDEAWWKARVESLRAQRTKTQQEREAAEQKFNQLRYFGRETLEELQEQQMLQRHIDQLTEQLAKIDQQTRALSEEARKAGAPPGWLRP
ncbi:MAG: DUF4124 domain-containing protein [Nitrospirota bacterium]